MKLRWVVAIVATAAVVLAGCSSSGSPAPLSQPPSTVVTTSTASASSSSSSAAPSSSASSSAAAPAGPAVVHQKLTNFRLIDVTFVGSQEWALGSADCLNGQGTCDAIEYSGDSGKTWRSAPSPKAGIGAQARPCAAPCVAHLRFASSKIGYAYSGGGDALSSGSGAMFMTSDGGTTWKQQAGGAVALETLHGNVIRVVAKGGCNPPGCTYRVETSPIGSTTWHTVTLPGNQGQGDSVALARAGGYAYLLVGGNPAGGAQSARSVLWTSSTNGASWINRGEPCPQIDREDDSAKLAAAPDGSATVLCAARTASHALYSATSTNGGATFHAGSRTALGAASLIALGAASAKILLVSSDDTYRSTDAGKHFARLGANAGSTPGQVTWIGFGSASVGHAFRLGRSVLWSTTNAGAGWTKHTFA